MVILGPPGSGKGTQSCLLEKEYGLHHLSTGDILRAEIAKGTPAGKEAAAIIAAGDLVPDTLIIDLVRARLAEVPTPDFYLFDGFPRTVAQAQVFDALLAESGRRLDLVIALEVPDQVLVDRILHRAAIEGRSDDRQEAIEERMREYRLRTAPVLDRYRSQGVKVEDIDGIGAPEDVFARIRQAVGTRP